MYNSKEDIYTKLKVAVIVLKSGYHAEITSEVYDIVQRLKGTPKQLRFPDGTKFNFSDVLDIVPIDDWAQYKAKNGIK